jgi:hypothetical protein
VLKGAIKCVTTLSRVLDKNWVLKIRLGGRPGRRRLQQLREADFSRSHAKLVAKGLRTSGHAKSTTWSPGKLLQAGGVPIRSYERCVRVFIQLAVT